MTTIQAVALGALLHAGFTWLREAWRRRQMARIFAHFDADYVAGRCPTMLAVPAQEVQCVHVAKHKGPCTGFPPDAIVGQAGRAS